MLFVCRFQHVPRIASRLLGCPDVLAKSVSAAGFEPTWHPKSARLQGGLSTPKQPMASSFIILKRLLVPMTGVRITSDRQPGLEPESPVQGVLAN